MAAAAVTAVTTPSSRASQDFSSTLLASFLILSSYRILRCVCILSRERTRSERASRSSARARFSARARLISRRASARSRSVAPVPESLRSRTAIEVLRARSLATLALEASPSARSQSA